MVFENERVRVLEYTDRPGDRTTPHEHPDSVMYTLSAFRRRLHAGDAHRDVEMPAGLTGWLPAQLHAGENIGDTETHVLFVELKEAGRGPAQTTCASAPSDPSSEVEGRGMAGLVEADGPPPGSLIVVSRPQPWSLTPPVDETPRAPGRLTVASTSSQTR